MPILCALFLVLVALADKLKKNGFHSSLRQRLLVPSSHSGDRNALLLFVEESDAPFNNAD